MRRKWKAKAQQAFDNYPATEDASKFDNPAASDFHMGLNPKTGGSQYNDWEQVFGTVDKFKKWIGSRA